MTRVFDDDEVWCEPMNQAGNSSENAFSFFRARVTQAPVNEQILRPFKNNVPETAARRIEAEHTMEPVT